MSLGVRGIFRFALGLVLLASALPLMPSPAAAVGSTYWVDAGTGSDSNIGSESQPFKTITKAASVSFPEDTIMVGPGLYNEGHGEVFPIVLWGQSLKGAGPPKAFVEGNGTDGLFAGQGFTGGDEISGFSFIGGRRSSGGALDLHLSAAMDDGALRIVGNSFSDNRSTGFSGGALRVFASDNSPHRVEIADNGFLSNHAVSAGGAVSVSGHVDVVIRDNNFEGHTAGSTGGAVSLALEDGSTVLDGNGFRSNLAASHGGALHLANTGVAGTHLITDNTFLYNNAPRGGALDLFGVAGTLSGTRAGNNTAVGHGGFAYVENCELKVINNIIDANASAFGAAFSIFESIFDQRHDTVIHHEDAAQATYADDASTFTVVNSIYWNSAISGDVEGADSLSYSCVWDPHVGAPAKRNVLDSGVIWDDPLLVDDTSKPLPDLEWGSPCIDKANPANTLDVDVYGTARPVDGDFDGIALPDMGCFEYVPTVATIQHDSAGVVFDRWVTGYSTAYSGGGYVYGRWTGTTLHVRFNGSKIRWVGPKQPAYGMANIIIDGAALVATDVDCYAPDATKTLSATIWESDTLSDGPHTLTIQLVGHKNPASSGYYVVADRFEVAGSEASGLGMRIDDSLAVPGYAGTWLHYINPTYFNRTYAYSRWTNAAFTVDFEGTKVAWIGPRTPNYGMADVYIDGINVATVDQYRENLATQGWREVVWESGTLSPGMHTVVIKPTGTKNPASTAANIVIDAIDVTE